MKKQKGKTFIWRMREACVDCPFSDSTLGTALRKSLRPTRVAHIQATVLRGDPFYCHQTTKEVGNGSELACAGALQYQHDHGVVSPYELLCRTLEGCAENKTEMFRRLKRITQTKPRKRGAL